MALDPVVIQIPIVPVPTPPPESRWAKIAAKMHLPHFGLRTSKIITAVAAIIIAITMVLFAVLTVLSSNDKFREKHGLNINQQVQPAQVSGSTKSAAALPGGTVATGVGGTTGTNAPVVTLTASQATVTTGASVDLKWSVTNSPSTCTASDDWSGSKNVSGGSESSGTLSKVQTYLFTLTCKTKTGTGFSTVSVQAIAQGGTGSVAKRPTVTLSAAKASIYATQSTTLNWSATNNPTSCTATGSWSGIKSATGSESTGTLTTAKSYSYTLTCVNSAGSGYATATVLVNDLPPDIPIVSISSNPVSPVLPGTSATISWSTTNNPMSCVASDNWSGNKPASGTFSTGVLNLVNNKTTTYSYTITCSNSAGGTFDNVTIAVIPNAPSVGLTVSPSSMNVGSSATITWSPSTGVTNKADTCTATGDWTGAKSVTGGSQSTGALNTAKTYLYSISCKNDGGTGFANNVPLSVTLPSPPTVTLSASPISVTTGSSSTLTWVVGGGTASSCTASGDWTGAKTATAGSHTASTGALATARTYNYSISCTNAGGTNTASTSVTASAGGGTVVAPVTSISVSPSSIGTGSSATISWSATNNPTSCTASGSWSGSQGASGTASTGVKSTAGTFTYTLTCSNSAGSNAASATLTVLAIPVVTISVSPTSINSGSSSTITWSATNSPTSCTAGGSWTGSKAASGTQTTGTMSTAGSYTYSLSCTNSGGTASNSTTLTVSNPAPVYCSGLTPCYGPTDLAAHATVGNCWGWNLTWVLDITTFRPSHKGGIKSGSTSTIENATATCNHDIHSILTGGASIPGYKDSGGSTTHGHASATNNNSASSQMLSYRKGYYDATKP